MIDKHTNFAYSTLASGITAGATSASVHSGDGALFPGVSFNAVIFPAGSLPLSTNAEIVRVTARSTDTLTISRAQEGSTARAFSAGDVIFAGPTAKTLTDAEQAFANDASLLQYGVIGSGDLAISALSVNGSTAAITFTVAAASPCWVKNSSGLLVPVYVSSQTVTLPVASGDRPSSLNTALYDILIDSSGNFSYVVDQAALSGNHLIRDFGFGLGIGSAGTMTVFSVSVYNNAGTYQLSISTSSTQGTNWIDRRSWARGALASATPTTSGPTTAVTSVASAPTLSEMILRVECTGAPVELLFNGEFQNNTAGSTVLAEFSKDGTAIGPVNIATSATASAAVAIGLSYIDTPAAGTHVYNVLWWVGGNTGTAPALRRSFSVKELLRVNANNGVV